MNKKTSELNPYKFNEEFFEDIKGTDYEALKEDISQNGIKVELHITKDNTILCGHQRWEIAKELELSEVPVKVIDIDEADEGKVKEYVIKDNLLRRHLSKEQQYILIATLSEVYELPKFHGNQYTERSDATVASDQDDVLTKTAKDTGVGERTVARARQYKELIKKSPELKKKKVTEVLKNYEIKKEKVVKKDSKIEIDLNTINPYDSNMFHFSKVCYVKKFGKDVICVDPSHKEADGEYEMREYKDYYPTVTKISCFFHSDGTEFSLRDYAKVQDFPKDFKFVGTSQEIKNQIAEAVSSKMAKYILKKHIKGKKYIEIFGGAGGFSVGAHNLGKKCLWYNDFNKYAGYSFKLNFPKTEVCIDDIQKINEKEIHKEIGDVDFIMGGPPCQGFSVGGKKLGFKEDKRNQLYLDFVRFVKEFKPKQFIMENVQQILNNKDEIVSDFEKIGYDVITEKVNGLDIGMKQRRIRVFFIGNKKGETGDDNTSRS